MQRPPGRITDELASGMPTRAIRRFCLKTCHTARKSIIINCTAEYTWSSASYR